MRFFRGLLALDIAAAASAQGIRACIANYRTTERDIDLVIDRLVALGAQ